MTFEIILNHEYIYSSVTTNASFSEISFYQFYSDIFVLRMAISLESLMSDPSVTGVIFGASPVLTFYFNVDNCE